MAAARAPQAAMIRSLVLAIATALTGCADPGIESDFGSAPVGAVSTLAADAPIFETVQPNGRRIMLRPARAEHFSWYTDLAGYTVVQKHGQYRYAARAGDGRLQASDSVVGADDPTQIPGLSPGIEPSAEVVALLVAEAQDRPLQHGVADDRPLGLPEGHSIVGGDIAVPFEADDVRTTAGVYQSNGHWPDGIIPYAFDANVSAANQAAARAAMDIWEAVSNVRFIPRTTEPNYVKLFSGSGNWSYVGMIGGEQLISIYNWTYTYIICHELNHAMGVWHEQSRVDRDTRVTVNYGNILDGYEGNFDIHPTAPTHGTYDFDSIMHYPGTAFTSNGQQTITVLPPNQSWQNLIGQRNHLSIGDAATIASIYGSPNPSVADALLTTDAATPIAGMLVGSDPNQSALTFAIVDNGDHGTALVTDPAAGTFTYTPQSGSDGNTDSFTFTADNGSAESLPGTVVVVLFAGELSPAAGTTLATEQTFYWKAVNGAAAYRMTIGDTPGTAEHFDELLGNVLTCAVDNLPHDGRALHVRLSAQVSGDWQDHDYVFEATDVKARLTSHADGEQLQADTVTLTWSAGQGASEYHLHIGSIAAAHDLHNQSHGTALSTTVSNLPTDGRTLYLRLWSQIGGDWLYADSTLTAMTAEGPGPAELTSHADGATLDGAMVTFAWDAAGGAQQYYLYVGTTAGGYDLLSRDCSLNLSTSVDNLPTNGSAIYLRLFTKLQGQWEYKDYALIADQSGDGEGGGGGGGETAELTSHADGDTLAGSTVTLTWSAAAGATEYYLHVGSSNGGYDLHNQGYDTGLTAALSGLPSDGSTVHIRLWSKISGQWEYRDYSVTAFNGGGGGGGAAAAELTSHADGDTLSGSSVTLAWSAGTGVTEYYLHIGSTAGGYNLHNQGYGTAHTAAVTGLPTTGSTLYVRLWSKIGGTWESRDRTLIASSSGGGGGGSDDPAELTSHEDGNTLDGTTATFTWSAADSATEYYLYVGSTLGGYDLHSSSYGLGLTATVDNLPDDGRSVYVRIYSKIGGVWQFNDASLTATGSGAAELTSHDDGDTLSGASESFSWNPVSSASQYYIHIGTTAGAYDLYNQGHDTALAAAISGLPTGGSTLHFRLWTKIAGSWQYRDYTFIAAP